MNVKYDLVVDFARPSKSNTIMISENDNYSRVLHFTLLNNKQPMSMSDVSSAIIQAIKKDGSVIGGVAEILTDDNGQYINELNYSIPNTMTDNAGMVTLVIILQSNTGQSLSSFETYLQVRNALYNEDDYVSETDFSNFNELFNKAITAVNELQELAEQSELPNPYSLNIKVEGEDHVYRGDEEVEVELSDMAYIADDPVTSVDALDTTATNAASLAATSARQYAEAAAGSAADAKESEELAEGYAETARTAKNTVENKVGLAEAYALDATNNALVAEGWAKGTQNGVEVGESSPYYRKNAEFFSSRFAVEDRLDSADSTKSLSANQGRILNDTKANKTELPTKLSDLTDDATHRLVTDEQISAWNNGGAGDYESLSNLPSINSVELSGNKSLSDLGINIPNVPSWALENSKPTYTASEVGALPDTTVVPTSLSDLNSDASHRTVSDAQISAWSNGTDVEWNQLQTSGTKIAEITIDGTKTDVYAAAGGGGGGTTYTAGNEINIVGDKINYKTNYGTSEEFEQFKLDASVPVGATYHVTDDYTEAEAPSYTDVTNKPKINSVTLSGNKSADDLGLALKTDLNKKENVIHHYESMADYEANKSEVADGDLFSIDDYEENKGEIYSTNELRCGTWIDNKPIYRKSVKYIANKSKIDGEVVMSLPNNLDEILRVYGSEKINNSYVPLGYFQSTTDKFQSYVWSDGIHADAYHNNQTIQHVNITIEYTKTTD